MKRGKLHWCEKCKRPLLERLSNGLWRFKFGRKNKRDAENKEITDWAVDMYIHGSVRIRCFRNGCLHWNIFNFFPPIEGSKSLLERR